MSAKCIQLFCGRLDFVHIAVLRKLKFYNGLYQCFFVKEYFPVPSSGGNQCKNRHAPIWHFG